MTPKKRSKRPAKLDAGKLRDYGLRLLAGRSYSTGEIQAKLRSRAERAGDVEPVLRQLKDYGYLDDRKFAEAYAAARLENEGHGRARVLRDLRQKRIPRDVAEAAVETIYGDADETKLIVAYLRRKFRGVQLEQHLAEPKKLAAAFRRLRYAGYSASNSIRVLRRFSDQAEQLEQTDPEEE